MFSKQNVRWTLEAKDVLVEKNPDFPKNQETDSGVNWIYRPALFGGYSTDPGSLQTQTT